MIAIAKSAVLAVLALAGDGPFQSLTYDQALARATAEKKVVFIDFYTTWCGPCKKLDAVTWKDADVQKWFAEKTVALKIDAEKQVELAGRFKVNSYPTLLLLKADGGEIDRLIGYRDAKTFLTEVEQALGGKNSVTRAKELLDESLARAKQKVDADGTDLRLRNDYADELARAGRDEEALREYLVVFDEGRGTPYNGVRLSFMLGNIVELGQRHPPAITALETRRDAAETRLLAGSKEFADLQDFTSINGYLKSDARTLALYDKLKQQGPIAAHLRPGLLQHLPGMLAEARRYADVLELVGDPDVHLRQALFAVEKAQEPLRTADESQRETMEMASGMLRSRTVAEQAHVYEALLGTKDHAGANRIADRLIELSPKGWTYATLMASAARAGETHVADELASRARGSLDDKELKFVERAAKKIAKAAK